MGSTGKKRTTMAKLNREAKLRDKRVEKRARKAARKLSAAHDASEEASSADELGTAPAGLEDGGSGAGTESVEITSEAVRGGT